jgi:tetratricopeptide (TPR) repeat protein
VAELTETRIKCPYCAGTVGPDSTVCPDCQEELAALFRLEFGHVVLYNQALALARNGAWLEARNKLLAAIEAAPDFAPAHRLLTKVYVQAGDWEAAHRALVRGLEAAPGDSVMLQMQPVVLRGVRHQERRYERRSEPSPVPGPAAAPAAAGAEESRIGTTLGLGAAIMSGLWLVWRLIGPSDRDD